jgi:hypothetical protein
MSRAAPIHPVRWTLGVLVLLATPAFGWTPHLLSGDPTWYPNDVAIGDVDQDGELAWFEQVGPLSFAEGQVLADRVASPDC